MAEGQDVPVVVAHPLVPAGDILAHRDDEPLAAPEGVKLVVHGAADALRLPQQEGLVAGPGCGAPTGEDETGVGVEVPGVVPVRVRERPARETAPGVHVALVGDGIRGEGVLDALDVRARVPQAGRGVPLKPRRPAPDGAPGEAALIEEGARLLPGALVGQDEAWPVGGQVVLARARLDGQVGSPRSLRRLGPRGERQRRLAILQMPHQAGARAVEAQVVVVRALRLDPIPRVKLKLVPAAALLPALELLDGHVAEGVGEEAAEGDRGGRHVVAGVVPAQAHVQGARAEARALERRKRDGDAQPRAADREQHLAPPHVLPAVHPQRALRALGDPAVHEALPVGVAPLAAAPPAVVAHHPG